MSDNLKIEIKLVSKTENPLGTLYYIWQQSRGYFVLPHPEYAQYLIEGKYPEDSTEELIRNTVQQLIDDDVPVLENIHFTFALENIPISLREQLVRHRVGVTIGDQSGTSMIPELGSSSFWCQTSRMVPMTHFATEGKYIVPTTLEGKATPEGEKAEVIYHTAMYEIENAYAKLLSAGVPMEDVRQLIPVGATHNITWTLSLKSIKYILGKRACWIAQAGLWGEVIQGIHREMSKVSPLFSMLAQPPCMKKGKYTSCPIAMINYDRMKGDDPYPPCPLWARKEGADYETKQGDIWYVDNHNDLYSHTSKQHMMMRDMTRTFKHMWKLEPSTGLPIKEPIPDSE